MTAQQQLAELNAVDGNWSDATEAKAAGWVDKHGSTVAELLDVMARLRAHNDAPFGSIETPMLSVKEYADLCVRRDAALRKLTQEATP